MQPSSSGKPGFGFSPVRELYRSPRTLTNAGSLAPGRNGWDGSYLSRMLRNPVYKGEARYRVREFVEAKSRRSVHHAAEDTKNSPRIRPEDDWVIFEVPAIFSDSQWAAIQTELGKRGMPKRDVGAYLLSRRFESACGAMYHGNRNNGKPRYLCSRRINRKYRGDEDCGCSQVSAPMVDEAVWRGVAEILFEPERLATLAQQELRRRGLEQSEAHLKRQLQSLDRKILRAREALNRLVRYHAEKGTLGEEGFESASASIRNEIEFLTYDRNKLMVVVPGRRLAQDQRAIAKIASEASERLQELSFEEKQRLLALLDVRVRVDEHGHLRGSLCAPQVESQRKVANRTSSQESPTSYLPRKYTVNLQKRDGLADLAFSLSLPRGSWSRKHPRCLECGTSRKLAGEIGWRARERPVRAPFTLLTAFLRSNGHG